MAAVAKAGKGAEAGCGRGRKREARATTTIGGRGNPGKGEYYKNLYGGGGRGKGGGGGGKGGYIEGEGGGGDGSTKRLRTSGGAELRATLLRIDGRPYPAYNDIKDVEYDLGRFSAVVQHVQSDPFAPPSRCYVRVPLAHAAFPPECFSPPARETALRDWLTRRFHAAAKRAGVDQRSGEGGWHGPKEQRLPRHQSLHSCIPAKSRTA